MKLLFLDIDGVCNSMKFNEVSQSYNINYKCVEYLNQIIEYQPDLYVVLSSAWRYMILKGQMTLLGFKYLLQSHGVTAKIKLIGCCGEDWQDDYCNRGYVINQWLENFSDRDKVKKVLILDDSPPGMTFEPVSQYLYKTNGKTGLTALDVFLIKEYLNDEKELTNDADNATLELRKEN